MKTIKDPLTGETFYQRRKNQRFVSSKNRIDFNNQKARDERISKAFIDKPLQRNHKILMELLLPDETKSFAKEFLIEKGYSLSVMSHYESHNDKVSPALYNFILIDLGENKSSLTIHRKK